MYVENLSEHKAESIEEAYVIIMYGLHRRKMFATIKNQESSRSHIIFQIKICSSKTGQVVSKFSLVDLAGSERLSDLEKLPERIEEAKYINKSLSALGNVISVLKQMQLNKEGTSVVRNSFNRTSCKRKLHIPYRDSRLTHILKDSLGGNSLTHIIITLSPSVTSL